MKKWFLLALITTSSLLAAEPLSQEQVLAKLQQLQDQIALQQNQIEALQAALQQQATIPGPAQLNAIVKAEVNNSLQKAITEQGLAKSSDIASVLTLGKNIEGLKLTGDLRLRYENLQLDNGIDDTRKERYRSRFRLGFVWNNPTENWEIGAGLATGEASTTKVIYTAVDTDGDGQVDSVKTTSVVLGGESGATSTNDTWNGNSAFETGEIFLDYAYAKHKWPDLGLSLTLGQQKNPFETTWLLWDSDVRPTGGTLHYAGGPMFATAGAYNVRYAGTDETLANMYAGQVGAKLKGNRVKATLAAGLYHYDDQVSEEYGLVKDQYNYDIADIYGQIDSKIREVAVKAYGQACLNLGANNVDTQAAAGVLPADYDSEEENLAWMIGAEAKYKKLTLAYEYAYVGGDSVPYFTTDADFGSGLDTTNVEGHKLSAAYSLTKHCQIGATALLYKYIEANPVANDDDARLYQLDLSYKF